jgi:HlyD family secretion protein
MRGKGLLATALVALGAALAGCGKDSGPAPVEHAVRRADFEVALLEQGIVEARRVIEIVAPFRSRVLMIADTGQDVREGDVVVRLDQQNHIDDLKQRLDELNDVKKDLEATVQRLEIAMRSNQMDVDAAASELSMRRVELQEVGAQLAQTQALQERELVSQEEVLAQEFTATDRRLNTISEDFVFRSELASRELDESSNLIDIERFALRGARAQRRVLEADAYIKSAEIRSPANGVFLRKSSWRWTERRNVEVKVGDQVREGQVIAEVPDLDSLVVRTQVPENAIQQVSVGTLVSVGFDGLSGGDVTGKITNIARSAVEREASAGGSLVDSASYSGQKVFEVFVALDEKPAGLRPGLTAEVSVLVERQEQVLVAPIEAIERRDGRLMVQVREQAGSAQWREVEVGSRNDNMVVLTGGVSEGDVLLRPAPAAKPRT